MRCWHLNHQAKLPPSGMMHTSGVTCLCYSLPDGASLRDVFQSVASAQWTACPVGHLIPGGPELARGMPLFLFLLAQSGAAVCSCPGLRLSLLAPLVLGPLASGWTLPSPIAALLHLQFAGGGALHKL